MQLTRANLCGLIPEQIGPGTQTVTRYAAARSNPIGEGPEKACSQNRVRAHNGLFADRVDPVIRPLSGAGHENGPVCLGSSPDKGGKFGKCSDLRQTEWPTWLYRAKKTEKSAEYPEEEPSMSGCRRGCGTDIGGYNGFPRQNRAFWSEIPYAYRPRASIGGRMSNTGIQFCIVSGGSAVCQVVFSYSGGRDVPFLLLN
jgi:hypothetical protein